MQNISNKVLKNIINPIAEILSYLFNLSFEKGLFPDCFKVSKVIPNFKSGSSLDMNNYRPISIIPSLSKILEKIVKLRLNSFLDKFNIITKHQFGFLKGRSTELALIKYFNDIYNNHNKDAQTLSTFIDFSKAFDSINHQILFDKMEVYGIRGLPLQWFKSYLSERKQYVQINRSTSSLNNISSGVPQGSVLGPLLFNLFINDIINSAPNSQFVVYADDTTVYNSSFHINDLFSEMNLTLDKINTWAFNNELLINTKKTKFMYFGNKNSNATEHALKIGSLDIEGVKSFKLLGVVIDERLDFKMHIDNVIKIINKNLGVINKIKFYFTKSSLLNLYYSLIFPHLYYCNIIWGPATKTFINKLYLLQKKFIRIVKNYGDPQNKNKNTADLFNEYKIMTIYELNNFKSACFFHNLIQNKFSTLNFNYKINKKNTRLGSNEFNLIPCYTPYSVIASRNIFYYGVSQWNQLPDYVKICNTYKHFKFLVKNYLNCLS